MTSAIQECYLAAIDKKEKTVEARLNRGQVSRLRAGDHICLSTGDRLEVAEISRVRRFDTFRDMLESCGLRRCLPLCRSLKAEVEVYHVFFF